MEEILEMELGEDIGDWVTDGVVPCKLVKILHPPLMPTFHAPTQGKVSHHHFVGSDTAFVCVCVSGVV